jgi:type IV fimbrial biogenesis protein FimT
MAQPVKSSVIMSLAVVNMKNKGFTLIELMITVAIISVTMGIGLPSFQSIIASARLTSTTNAMVSALQLARVEALKQHKTVVIRKKSTDWKNGWNVFVDDKVLNNTIDADEPILVVTAFDSVNTTVTVQATYTNFVSYNANGRVNTAGHFTFCSGTDYRSVIIAATGRIRTTTITSCT